MINNKIKSPSDDIDLKDLLSGLWSDKKLISFITLLFVFLGYIYSLTLNKSVELESKITITEPAKEYFSDFSIFLKDAQILFHEEVFLKNFRINILSLDNLQRFIDQNNEISEFKALLLERQTNAKKYFIDKIYRGSKKIDEETSLTNSYYLNYSEILDGNKFLDEYIIYSKNIAMSNFKDQIRYQINNIILLYEQNLEIALNINLSNPLIQSLDGKLQSSLLDEPANIYFQGALVLQKRISHLKILLKRLDGKFYYDPILDISAVVGSNTKNLIMYPFYGLLIGFIISLIMSLFRVIK